MLSFMPHVQQRNTLPSSHALGYVVQREGDDSTAISLPCLLGAECNLADFLEVQDHFKGTSL